MNYNKKLLRWIINFCYHLANRIFLWNLHRNLSSFFCIFFFLEKLLLNSKNDLVTIFDPYFTRKRSQTTTNKQNKIFSKFSLITIRRYFLIVLWNLSTTFSDNIISIADRETVRSKSVKLYEIFRTQKQKKKLIFKEVSLRVYVRFASNIIFSSRFIIIKSSPFGLLFNFKDEL